MTLLPVFQGERSYYLGILIGVDRQLKRYHISVWKNDYFIIGMDCAKSNCVVSKLGSVNVVFFL